MIRGVHVQVRMPALAPARKGCVHHAVLQTPPLLQRPPPPPLTFFHISSSLSPQVGVIRGVQVELEAALEKLRAAKREAGMSAKQLEKAVKADEAKLKEYTGGCIHLRLHSAQSNAFLHEARRSRCLSAVQTPQRLPG